MAEHDDDETTMATTAPGLADTSGNEKPTHKQKIDTAPGLADPIAHETSSLIMGTIAPTQMSDIYGGVNVPRQASGDAAPTQQEPRTDVRDDTQEHRESTNITRAIPASGYRAPIMFSAVMPEVAAVDCLPAAPASPHEDTDTDQVGELLALAQEGSSQVFVCPCLSASNRSPFCTFPILNHLLLGEPLPMPLGRLTRATPVDSDPWWDDVD